jgi:hypothetical protein
MKKYLFLFLTFTVFAMQLKAETINEYMNDIYFANGINTSRASARITLDNTIRVEVLKQQYYQKTNFKLAYNNTLGIAFDLLEAYNQKQAEHGTFWWVLGTAYDVYGSIAGRAVKEVTSELLEEIILDTLKKTGSQFVLNPLIEAAGLNDLKDLVDDLRSGASPANVWKTLVDSAKA